MTNIEMIMAVDSHENLLQVFDGPIQLVEKTITAKTGTIHLPLQ